jgi:gamma-aminobutyric acid type B receptor
MFLFSAVAIILAAQLLPSLAEHSGDNTGKIRFLTLVPWEDELNRTHAGWDAGPDLLAAGRVAVKEVNQRSDLLPGYELEMIEGKHESCGLTGANNGIYHLTREGFDPPNNTVIAVLGLFCSTSAVEISRLAGMANLLQISAANSPVFSDVSNFPYLWRVLVSADAYAEMTIQLLIKRNWSRIAIIQDIATIFHSGIGDALTASLPKWNFTLHYHNGLVQTRQSIVDNSLMEIKNAGARIVFVSATGPQTAQLLCTAAEYDMVYPDYVWIITDFFVSSLEGEIDKLHCDKATLHKGTEGILIAFFNLDSANMSSFTNASGKSYANYSAEYEKELQQTKAQYYDTGYEKGDVLYAGLLYDQVWALALGLNDSLPKLESENIHLDGNNFNSKRMTDIIEESLRKVSFIGATGHIKFTDDREVLTPIDIFQVSNSTEVLIAKYFITNKSLIFINEASLDLPNDTIPHKKLLFSNVHYVVVAALYSIIIGVSLIVIVFLALFIHCRKKPEIKATGLLLSLIMSCGCFCLCLDSIIVATLASFEVSKPLFAVLCNMDTLLLFNGLSLIFVTLFIRLLRIHKIFNNNSMSYLGWCWRNYFLTFVILVITIIPNLLWVVWVSSSHLNKEIRSYIEDDQPVIKNVSYSSCESTTIIASYL